MDPALFAGTVLGNKCEDVKEYYYYYLDSVPTHAYMKMLYKYPQNAFPYRRLVEENATRGKHEPELELIATGAFDNDEYFDVFVEYAKHGPDAVLIKITAANRSQGAHALQLLPTLWFCNEWSWKSVSERPHLARCGADRRRHAGAQHPALGEYRLYCEDPIDLLFTGNAWSDATSMPDRRPASRANRDVSALTPVPFYTRYC